MTRQILRMYYVMDCTPDHVFSDSDSPEEQGVYLCPDCYDDAVERGQVQWLATETGYGALDCTCSGCGYVDDGDDTWNDEDGED